MIVSVKCGNDEELFHWEGSFTITFRNEIYIYSSVDDMNNYIYIFECDIVQKENMNVITTEYLYRHLLVQVYRLRMHS